MNLPRIFICDFNVDERDHEFVFVYPDAVYQINTKRGFRLFVSKDSNLDGSFENCLKQLSYSAWREVKL